MDIQKKPNTFGDIVRVSKPKKIAPKKNTNNQNTPLKLSKKIANDSPNKIVIAKPNKILIPKADDKTSKVKKIRSLNLSSKKINSRSSDLAYRLNDKIADTETAVVFKRHKKLKPNSIQYIQQNKETNYFNNQALLFENNSLFGNFAKKIKSNREISGTPLLKKLKQKNIKKIPIESTQKLNSRMRLISVENSNNLKSVVYLFTSALIFILLGLILVFNTVLGQNQISNASSNNEMIQFENISILKQEYQAYSESFDLPSNMNIDSNLNGLSNWQDFYLDLNPIEEVDICNTTNHIDLIFGLVDFENCEKINIIENQDSKNIDVLKYLLKQQVDDEKISEYSLLYIFGLEKIEDFENSKDALRLSGSDSAIDNLILITKIDAYINGRINTFNDKNTNPIEPIYYLEASKNYNVSLAKIMTFSLIDSNFYTQNTTQDSQDLIKDLNYTTAMFEVIQNQDINQCEKYLLLNNKFSDCNDIENTISSINSFLS